MTLSDNILNGIKQQDDATLARLEETYSTQAKHNISPRDVEARSAILGEIRRVRAAREAAS